MKWEKIKAILGLRAIQIGELKYRVEEETANVRSVKN